MASAKLGGPDGRPLLVLVSLLYEDAHNPRTEFPDESLAELAEDIQQRGVLQPLVVHPADGDGRHCVHFGAKRLRAAIRAGLQEVPVVVRDLPADRYAQVAENQKRHGLTPLELARFIRAQVDAGDSNATIARQLGGHESGPAYRASRSAALHAWAEITKALASSPDPADRKLSKHIVDFVMQTEVAQAVQRHRAAQRQTELPGMALDRRSTVQRVSPEPNRAQGIYR